MTFSYSGKYRRGAIRTGHVLRPPRWEDTKSATGGAIKVYCVDVIDEYGHTWHSCQVATLGGGRSGVYVPLTGPLSKKGASSSKTTASRVLLSFGDGTQPHPVVIGQLPNPLHTKERIRKKSKKITGTNNASLKNEINKDDFWIEGQGGGRIIVGGKTSPRIEIDTRFTNKDQTHGHPIFLSVGGDISNVEHASHVVITQNNRRAHDRLLLAHSTGILIEKMCAKIDQLEATVTALYNWAKQMNTTSGLVGFTAGIPQNGGGWTGNASALVIPEFKGSDWCKPEETVEGKRVTYLGGSLPKPDLEGIGSDAKVDSGTPGDFKGVGLKQFPAMTMRGHAADNKGYPSTSDYDAQYWADRSKTTGEGQYLRFWTDKTGSKKAPWYDWNNEYELHRELSRYCVSSVIRITPNSLWSENNKLPGDIPRLSPQVWIDLNAEYWTPDNYPRGK